MTNAATPSVLRTFPTNCTLPTPWTTEPNGAINPAPVVPYLDPACTQVAPIFNIKGEAIENVSTAPDGNISAFQADAEVLYYQVTGIDKITTTYVIRPFSFQTSTFTNGAWSAYGPQDWQTQGEPPIPFVLAVENFRSLNILLQTVPAELEITIAGNVPPVQGVGVFGWKVKLGSQSVGSETVKA